MKKAIFYLLIMIVLLSCIDTKNKKTISVVVNQDSLNIITQKKDSLNKIIQEKDSLKLLEQKAAEKFKNIKFKPIWGDRISILGDFDGDGIIDTLKESFISRLTNKETYKEYEGYNYIGEDKNLSFDEMMFYSDTLINFICSKQPEVLLKCSSKNVKTLKLPYSCQSCGIDYLINVGDLNADKRDEIAILRGYIKFAGMTTACNVYSFDGEKWKNALSFTVYGPIEQSYKKGDNSNIRRTKGIPGFLEKKNDKWYYRDYNWQGMDSERRVLKIK